MCLPQTVRARVNCKGSFRLQYQPCKDAQLHQDLLVPLSLSRFVCTAGAVQSLLMLSLPSLLAHARHGHKATHLFALVNAFYRVVNVLIDSSALLSSLLSQELTSI